MKKNFFSMLQRLKTFLYQNRRNATLLWVHIFYYKITTTATTTKNSKETMENDLVTCSLQTVKGLDSESNHGTGLRVTGSLTIAWVDR